MATDSTRPAVLIDIRKAVVQQHEAALQAVAMLERYLAEGRLDAGIASQLACIQRLIDRSTTSPSIRERVLAAIPAEGATVEAIHASTGLTKKQIRGVLYAPEIKEFVTNNRTTGQNRFYHRINQKISGERVMR